MKKRIPPLEASTSKKRKSHIDTTGKGSKEAPPVPQETIFDLNRGKFVDNKGKQTTSTL